MDFRKVWESAEIRALAKKLGIPVHRRVALGAEGIVDGDNTG